MTARERILALATARHDRAAIAIVQGSIQRRERCVFGVDLACVVDPRDPRYNPFLLCDSCLDSVFGPRCTASTGIASHPVCEGRRDAHGVAGGPFHPFVA